MTGLQASAGLAVLGLFPTIAALTFAMEGQMRFARRALCVVLLLVAPLLTRLLTLAVLA